MQGRIEHLAVAAMALPQQVRVASFLPMAHLMGQMGRNGAVGDRVRRRLYRRPNLFIVPDAAVARQVVVAGAAAPIRVVENVVVPVAATKAEARSALGLRLGSRIAVYLGRMEAGQKGIDLLLAAIVRDAPALTSTTFLFVGDGPAVGQLNAVASAHSALDIRHVGWSDRADLYLAAADVLLMPSRWEGLPLVMLEAMTAGLPLLASRIDVFAAYLPAANLIDFAQEALSGAIERIQTTEALAAYRSRAQTTLAGRSLTTSRAAFAQALKDAVQ